MKGLRIVAVVVLLAGCGRAPSPTVFLDPALAVLVPRDTKLLAGVRLQRLRESPTAADLASQSPRLMQFRKDMGLPADSDVWEYLIAFDGRGWIALMRGKFTEMGMEPRLEKPGAARMSRAGVTVLGDENGAVAFLNPTTAIGGRLTEVSRALEQRYENSGVPQRLEELTKAISSKYDVWFVSTDMAPDFLDAGAVRTARGGLSLATRRYDLIVEADSGAREIHDQPVPETILDWVLGRNGWSANYSFRPPPSLTKFLFQLGISTTTSPLITAWQPSRECSVKPGAISSRSASSSSISLKLWSPSLTTT